MNVLFPILLVCLTVPSCGKSKSEVPPAIGTSPGGARSSHDVPRSQPNSAATPESTAAGASKPIAGEGPKRLGPISFVVPKEWVEQPVQSSMRAAQFTMGPTGQRAELVVYYFGQGGAGGVEANLDRWYSQFEQPDKTPSKARASRQDRQVAGMKVTVASVAGTYMASMTPGQEASPSRPDHRMIAAIVESSNGPYYFKIVGPKKTVDSVEPEFESVIGSLTNQ